jgi:hypothetical protein
MHRANASILCVVMLIIAWMGFRYWPDLQLTYATEEAPLAWLQSSLIFGCAISCALRATLPQRSPRDSWLWPAMALALVIAALDERFMLHEAIQDWLRYDVLDDAPWAARAVGAVTLAYALAGVTVLLALKKTALAPAFHWIKLAVSVGFAAVALDIAFNSLGWQTLEELLEVSAESLMLCGLFTEVRLAAQAPP